MTEFDPGLTVGIDLGTSYSAIAHLGAAGNVGILPNKYDDPITASLVILGRGQVVTVGRSDPGAVKDAAHIVTAVKRMMGNANYFLLYEGRRINAEFISAMILRRLLIDAEAQIGEIGNAVITVPYYFNDLCRRATVNAGRIAGVRVVDLLNEPTAAVLSYAWHRGELGFRDALPPRTVLVYDLGGGTFDVTVVRYTATHFEVLATDGDTLLGGIDWTDRLVGFVCDRISSAWSFDPRTDDRLMHRIRQGCDSAKAVLSERDTATISVNFKGNTLNVEVTRREFERLTADLLQRTRDTTELVLEQSETQPQDLDDLILIGGSTRMPSVHAMLRQLSGRAASAPRNPQLAVAEGAAIHAAMLEAQAAGSDRFDERIAAGLRGARLIDVNPHSLGVALTETENGNRLRNHVMIPRNHPLPCEASQRFVTTRSNPGAISIQLLEGEAGDINACTTIGECRIHGLPASLPVGSPVEVSYQYDAERVIRVTARELTGGREASVAIDRAGDLNDDLVDALRNLAADYTAS